MANLPSRRPIWPGAPQAAKPRQHVRQRGGGDCAIAAAATAAGVTYEAAASAAFSLRQQGLGGIRPANMVMLLDRLTGRPWTRVKYMSHCSWKHMQLQTMIAPPGLAVAFIVHPWKFWQGGHAIVICGGLVYDGSLAQPVKRNEHPRRGWLVANIFQPQF